MVCDTSQRVTRWPTAAIRSTVGRPVPEPMSSTPDFLGSWASSQSIAADCSGRYAYVSSYD
ncbi:hypothetical protein [Streptomyces sp. NPDC001450]